MAIEWFDIYKVDVKEIDLQHEYFVSLLNKLYLAAKKKDTKNLDRFLDEVAKYAYAHFETEERYFDEFNYKNSDEHKKDHLKMKERIEKFLTEDKRAVENSEVLYLELLDFMEAWLHNHLVEQDQKYVKCFHKNGVK